MVKPLLIDGIAMFESYTKTEQCINEYYMYDHISGKKDGCKNNY